MDAQTLIAKLQSDAADSLSALCVDAVLATPLDALFPPALTQSALRRVATAWVDSPTALNALTAVIESLVTQLQAERRALKEVVPKDVRLALREVLGRPFSPDRRVVLSVIDTGPTRELVRQLLLDAVLEFGRKASAPVAQVARGLGSLARLAGETVKSHGGGLGSLMGAVSGEVERQLEKRATEFVEAALGGVFGQLADSVSDPRRAAEAAELRTAFFDGLMGLTGPALARELMNLDVAGGAEVLRAGLKRYLASEESTLQLTRLSNFVFEQHGQRTLKAILVDLGLADVAQELAREQLAQRIRAISAAPEFSAWLTTLLGP